MTTSLHAWYAKYNNESDTPAWKVFNYRFLCKVQGIHMPDNFSPEFTYRSSEDHHYDYHHAQKFQDARLTIAEMAEIYDANGDLDICNPSVALEKIYNIVCDHILDSVEFNGLRINGNSIPVDDLKKLDRFAFAVFPKARSWLSVNREQSNFADFMAEFSIFERPEMQAVGKEHKSVFVDTIGKADSAFNRGNRFGVL